MTAEAKGARRTYRLPVGVGLLCFLAIAGFLLWDEHEAHIRGALPYAFLLLCPFIHLFMHHGHGHGHDQPRSTTED